MSSILNKSFPVLGDGLKYIEGLLGAGLQFESSRVWSDRFKRSKRNRYRLLLGVDEKAAAKCEKIAPGGTWGIEIETPGTTYEAYGLLGMVDRKTKHHRASAWYSRYLPYAVAMMLAEDDFEAYGVDFTSINSYYGTCMGFGYMGQGDDNISARGEYPAWDRINEHDVKLYDKLAGLSHSIRPPNLPFEEVHQPAVCFVAVQRPELLAYRCGDTDHWWWKHAMSVLEAVGLPLPTFKKPSRKPY